MKRTSKQYRAGFTMVELIVVIIILGLLAGVVANNFVGQTDKARVVATKTSLKTLHTAILQFKMDTGRYPEEEEGLLVLIEEPTDVMGWDSAGYLMSSDLPTDAWGREFIFQLDPDSGKPFAIISYGADGEPEGEDYDADLYSTDAN